MPNSPAIEANPTPGAGSQSVFMTEQETADFLRISVRSLQRWRQEGGQIRFRRFGGRVRYSMTDVLAWAEAQAVTSTSEHDR